MPMGPALATPGVQTSQFKAGGTFGSIVPIYALGIATFFVYTLMKIMKKNENNEDDNEENKDIQGKADNIEWDKITHRITNIGSIVDDIVEDEDIAKVDNPQDQEILLKDDEFRKPEDGVENRKSEKVKDKGNISEDVDPRDMEICLLKARLEETERAMERIVAQMGII